MNGAGVESAAEGSSNVPTLHDYNYVSSEHDVRWAIVCVNNKFSLYMALALQ